MNNYEFSKRVSESISDAQRYIGQKEACRGRNKANITVSINGKDNQCESTVFVYITSKNAAVIIDELHTGNNLQTNKYTADEAMPIRVHETRKPVHITPTRNGFLYDFGINDAGTFVLNIKNSTSGQSITLTLGEHWNGQGFNNEKMLFVPQALGQVDRYICRGEEEEVWSPMYVYHGYRYILVQGVTAEQATDTLLTYKVKGLFGFLRAGSSL